MIDLSSVGRKFAGNFLEILELRGEILFFTL